MFYCSLIALVRTLCERGSLGSKKFVPSAESRTFRVFYVQLRAHYKSVIHSSVSYRGLPGFIYIYLTDLLRLC